MLINSDKGMRVRKKVMNLPIAMCSDFGSYTSQTYFIDFVKNLIKIAMQELAVHLITTGDQNANQESCNLVYAVILLCADDGK